MNGSPSIRVEQLALAAGVDAIPLQSP